MHRRLALPTALILVLSGCAEHTASFSLPAPDAAPPLHYGIPQPSPNGPVLTTSDPLKELDILNPSVIRNAAGYENLYSVFDGTSWRTAKATSPDGLHWTKRGIILSPSDPDHYIAANGSALESRYWYQANLTRPEIRLANETVLRPGPYRSWDELGVADPYVMKQSGTFYLYYTGLDRANVQRLGVARSQDGVHWEKLVSNPILSPLGRDSIDEAGLGEPAVWQAGGKYWMLFTGRAWDEQRRIGLAESPDGVSWTRVNNWIFQGSEKWDSKVVCDPSVEVTEDGSIRLWFGGGDIARPDERLHGQIGYAFMKAEH